MIVAHLTDRHMPAAEIAAELGVSRETVRRDLLNRPDQAEAETPAPEAPAVAYGPEGLTLPASQALGQDLRLIAVAHKRPAEAVAEELLHWHAERIRANWQRQPAAS
ncbi:HTH domain-containing protein [Streptomyces kunmingensis]|uniref:HTH domain-containing protein n=1 Tax=Streptomyces kunmingensis TaxID=68225 RepID=A0ABU6CP54_9ACTN|nr:HTH domain-containing protein [Streptomyces kunmingensis]MEB3966244.1 HTH domain-containing protein [Streptomyces kunmingensis]